jgi:hypothetical protein
MKNIQIIDGARNSTFEIYEVPDSLYAKIFREGTDVAFLNDVEQVLEERDWMRVYKKKIDKKQVCGIHGTLHLTGSNCSKDYFPTRKEAEVLQN